MGVFDDIGDFFEGIGKGIKDVGEDVLGDTPDDVMTFNPETWCEDADSESLQKKPIKILICTAIEMMELILPTVRFIKTMMEIGLELILEANFLTETLIILAPIVPIAVLISYFLDTL